jgi:hypothetical protein
LEVVEREYIKEKKATAKDFEVLFFYIGVKQNIVTSYHHSKMTDTKLGEIIFSIFLGLQNVLLNAKIIKETV